jgi:hypothetical protein
MKKDKAISTIKMLSASDTARYTEVVALSPCQITYQV